MRQIIGRVAFLLSPPPTPISEQRRKGPSWIGLRARYYKQKTYGQPSILCIKIQLNEKITHSQLHTVFQICLIVDAKFGEDLEVTSTETPVSSPQNAGKIFSLSTGL